MKIETQNVGELANQFTLDHLGFIVLSSAGMFACWWAAGATLGLFFGGFFVATFLVPAAATTVRPLRHAAVIVETIGLFWLVAIFRSSDIFFQWVQLTVALSAYGLALAASTLFLYRIGIPDIIASACVIVLGLAWLTWPIWLAPEFSRLSEGTINRLVAVHPPLTANGVLTNEIPWTERTLAYQLTRLDQDVPIGLPQSAFACIAAHAVLGMILLLATWGVSRRWRKIFFDRSG